MVVGICGLAFVGLVFGVGVIYYELRGAWKRYGAK